MSKLSTDVIKAMFKNFFSTDDFKHHQFSYWEDYPHEGKRVSEDDEVLSELKLPASVTAETIINSLVDVLSNPKYWARSIKGRAKSQTWVLDALESAEAFEEITDYARIVDRARFDALGDEAPQCWARLFIFKTNEYDSTFGQDIDITIVTDPNDEHVLGFFVHED
jgi:hypothetical protein